MIIKSFNMLIECKLIFPVRMRISNWKFNWFFFWGAKESHHPLFLFLISIAIHILSKLSLSIIILSFYLFFLLYYMISIFFKKNSGPYHHPMFLFSLQLLPRYDYTLNLYTPILPFYDSHSCFTNSTCPNYEQVS